MPSRELKDTLQAEPVEPSEAPPIRPDSLQLPLTPAEQTWVVSLVLDDFEAALRARSELHYGTTAKGDTRDYDRWRKDLTAIYFGHREPKTDPWRFCSNRSLMIGMAILEVLHARFFPAIYNEDLTRLRPVETTDEAKAQRIEKLFFWWVRVRSELREFFDRWTRQVLAYGRALTVSTWDVQFLDRGETAPPTETLTPDGTVAVTPGARLFDTLEKTRADLVPDEDVFLQPGARDLQRDPVILRRRYLFRELEEMEANDQAVNILTPTDAAVTPLKDLLPLPGVTAPSGSTPEQEEVIKAVKRRNVSIEVLEVYTAVDLDGDGIPEPVRVLVNPTYRVYLGGLHQRDLTYRGVRHLDLTLYLPRLDDPHGQRGLGVLEQVQELALEIDAIFNQLTDANTLQILRPGFYDPAGELDVGAMKLAPNKMTPVPNPSQNVYFPDVQIPTERLLNAIKLVMEFIERLTSSNSTIFGTDPSFVGGPGTATRTQATVTASAERHSVPLARLRDGAARIMTHHLDLLQKHLPEGLESRVLGLKGEPVFAPNELSQEGIAGEFDVYLLPDDAWGSKETQRQLSQVLYSLLTQNLLVMSDPAKLYKVTADLLLSYGKDPESYLGPQPPINDAKSPQEEHTLLLQGDVAQVRATVTQNPIEHLLAHQALPQDPAFQQLPPALQQQLLAALQAHIQEHLQVMALVMSATQAKPGTQPTGGARGPNAPGTGRRGPGPSEPIGAEPGVGTGRRPLAAARQAQVNGTGPGAA